MGFKSALKTMVDVPRWMGVAQLKNSWSVITQLAADIFLPKKSDKPPEDFDAALQRLHLTETQLAERHTEFKRLVLIFGGASILLWLYTFYLLFNASFLFASLAALASSFLLAQTFRYHFWLFQLNKRKLGCSFTEWFHEGLLGKKS